MCTKEVLSIEFIRFTLRKSRFDQRIVKNEGSTGAANPPVQLACSTGEADYPNRQSHNNAATTFVSHSLCGSTASSPSRDFRILVFQNQQTHTYQEKVRQTEEDPTDASSITSSSPSAIRLPIPDCPFFCIAPVQIDCIIMTVIPSSPSTTTT